MASMRIAFLAGRGSKTRAIAAILLASGALTAVILHVAEYRRSVVGAHVARATSLTRSFAGVASCWLSLGRRSSLDVFADLLLETGAQGIDFATTTGVVYRRGLAQNWEPLDASDWRNSACLLDGRLFGTSSIEVTVLQAMSDEDSPYGCIRIRFSPTALNGALLGRASVVASAWALFVLSLGIGLRVIGSRAGSEADGTCSLVVDHDSKHILVGEEAVELPPKLFALIARLAETPGRVYSDEEILRAVWPESEYADSKDVKQCVYMLRRRLGRVCTDPESVIVNVKGHGYRLDLSGI
jgi:hypothetical protein